MDAAQSHVVQVAQQLGFRSRRRPAGYWDNEDNLDREIAQFVAANWTHMEHSQPASSYWYNQVPIHPSPGFVFASALSLAYNVLPWPHVRRREM